MQHIWTLFWAFARIGCFTFGGGYAMLPMLQKEVVDHYHWATEEEIMDYYAIGQCTPGVIAVNTATFIGAKHYGIIGAIFATLGLIFPSIVIILLIASILNNFNEYPVVQSAFAGIRIVVAVLVINVVINMLKTSIKDLLSIIIFIISVLVGICFSISPIYTIIVAALIGIVANQLGGFKRI